MHLHRRALFNLGLHLRYRLCSAFVNATRVRGQKIGSLAALHFPLQCDLRHKISLTALYTKPARFWSEAEVLMEPVGPGHTPAINCSDYATPSLQQPLLTLLAAYSF